MSRTTELAFLKAQLGQVSKMLAEISGRPSMERPGLEYRRREIESQISKREREVADHAAGAVGLQRQREGDDGRDVHRRGARCVELGARNIGQRHHARRRAERRGGSHPAIVDGADEVSEIDQLYGGLGAAAAMIGVGVYLWILSRIGGER